MSVESLRVLSAGAPRAAVLACLDRHGAAHHIDFATAPRIEALLGEPDTQIDVLIAPLAVLGRLREQGRTLGDRDEVLGSIRAGLVVNRSAPARRVDTSAALVEVLKAASQVVFNRASSGRRVERLLRDLDLEAALAGRIERTDTGAAVIERLAADDAGTAVGFAQSTEIRRLGDAGVRLLDLVPEPLMPSTTYAAVRMARGRGAQRAGAWMDFLVSSTGRQLLRDAGVSPPAPNGPRAPELE